MAKRKTTQKRNKLIKQDYTNLIAKKIYTREYILNKIAAKYWLNYNTIEKIIYQE